jgi:predicted dehydrogenase
MLKYQVHDHFSVLLRTAKQAFGVLEVSWFAKRPEALYEFTSSDGKRVQIIDYNLFLNLSKTPGNFLQGIYSDWKTSLKRWVGPIIEGIQKRELLTCLHHYNLITTFIESIKNDVDPPITPEDGRRAIHLLECIQESLNTNQPIKIKNDVT